MHYICRKIHAMKTIKRLIEERIIKRIAPNKAILIFGARRVGKTVLMRRLIDEFAGKTLLLNGEDYDTMALLEERSIANYRRLLDGVDFV